MSGNLIFDTNVIIDSAKGNKKASNFLESVDTVVISVMTAFELFEGCLNSHELATTENAVESFEIINVDERISIIALEIFRNNKLKYGISIGDSLIAATALSRNLVLVTMNTKHFNFIEELKIIKPY